MARPLSQHLYWLPQDALLSLGKPALWKKERLVPLVALDPLRFFGNPPAPCPLPDLDRAAGGPWYASLWVTNNPGGCLLWPWDDAANWQILIDRLARFRQGAPAGLQGLLLDFEYYPATPHGAAGPMDPKRAWLPHPRLRERANAFARTMGGWLLGGMVTTTEIRRLPGLEVWIRRMAKAGKTWVLSEGYTGADDPQAVTEAGAVYVPGFATVAEARQHARAWVYEPSLKALKKGG